MAKDTVYAWDTTAANNTDIASINIDEGCAPSGMNNAARTTMAQVADWRDQLTYRDVGGTANALTLTPSVALTAYASRLVVTFRATETNTAAATLNVSGLGAKAILKIQSGAAAALIAGDIQDNARYTATFDSVADAFILASNPADNGLFTPTVDGTSTAGAGTYSEQFGRYSRTGRIVFFEINLTWSAHTGTGNIIVSGLPFTSSGSSTANTPASIVASALTFSGQLVAYVPSNSTQVQIRTIATGSGVGDVAMDTSGTLFIAGCYVV